MTPNRGRIACHMTALLISLTASGCFVPGGGWTMRTGIDLRRCRKPSAFVELVDTRWDEFNRIAEINSMAASTPSPAVIGPGAGPSLMEGVPVPPASDPRIMPDSSRPSLPAVDGSQTSTPPDLQFPDNSLGNSPGNATGDNATGGDPTEGEPSRLPPADDGPAATPARDAPTARRSALDGPPTAASAPGDAVTDLSAAPSSAPATRRSRRPMASRLFSRPQ